VSSVAGGPSGEPAHPAFPIVADRPLPADRQQQLQAALDRRVRLAGPTVRGATAAVVTNDGVWAGASGVDGNGVPLQPTAMMSIGAVTSTITAAEVLSLAEAGVIDIDAPASTYLSHPLLHRDPTVRQLLPHTSGIPEYIHSQALSDAIIADPTRSWTPKEALVYATGPLTDPGPEAQNYSNSNYLLLGMLIENVTGLDYADAVHRDVLAGGDSRFAIQDAEAPTPPLAAPELTGTGDSRYLPNRAIATTSGAAGGIAADTPALALWGYRLYGGQVLAPGTTTELSTPSVPGNGYGLGTKIWQPEDGGTLVGHDSDTPGYSSTLAVDPAAQVSIVVLAVGATDTNSITMDLLSAAT
jgi:D-alanyl-D-alanine carboxypeptidase